MSELSKKMRRSRQRATQGEWYYIEMNDGDSLSSVGIECDSLDILELQSIPEYGEIDPCITICLTLLQSPRAVQHQSGKAYFNAEFIADAANETDNLCAEIDALEKENAEMRAELETLRRGPTVDPDPIDEDFEDQLRKCAD